MPPLATSKPLAAPLAPEQPPNPWMFTRLMRTGEDEHMLAIDAQVRLALAHCPRCSGIYEQTGLIPVSCHICGAERDQMWLACIEDAARRQPGRRAARPAIVTRNTFLRPIPGAR